jgi:hypothetical protein
MSEETFLNISKETLVPSAWSTAVTGINNLGEIVGN